ncbi:MAG: hypothetical protein PHS44_07260 [Candidatus Dojkabacteria bacterium]|nr:hypothetical protein [Candidatus Dojkabacteria bacterium]
MSKSLTKLIDTALIPAAVMICGKVAGLWFANSVFKLDWGILNDPNNFFSVKVVYPTLDQQITATTYSNVIMYLFVFLGFLFILIRAIFFSSAKISPKTIAKLATNNLLKLVGDSFEIYFQASVWLIVLWLALLALLVNVLVGRALQWTGVVSLCCTMLATVILLRDVYTEIIKAKSNLHKTVEENLQG